MLKFDKTLYNCYDKIIYIDANVRIHIKLSSFFDKLTKDKDMVLFRHPDRNTHIDEMRALYNAQKKT